MATLKEEIKHDYLDIDGIEEITLKPQAATAAAIRGVKALQRQLDRDDVSLIGSLGLAPDGTVWHMWETSMRGARPENGDKITDCRRDSWTIQSVSYSHMTSRWRAICTKVRV